MKKVCQLFFVRHGETDWNAQGLLQGHSDISLNEKGYSQALELREALAAVPFAAGFSSDLSRAKKTAEIILNSKDIPLIVSLALRERFAGPFEGKPVKELEAWMKQSLLANPLLTQEEHLSHRWHPHMETASEVYQRVKSFLDVQVPSYLGSNLLIVSHGGVIRSILDHFQYTPGYKWVIANCGFIQLEADTGEFLIKKSHGISFKKVV